MPRILAEAGDGRFMLGDQRGQARRHGLLDAAVPLGRASGHREAVHLAVETAQERLHLVHEGDVLLRHEVRAALLTDREQVGLALKQPLHHLGHVAARPRVQAAVQFLLGKRGQTGQVTRHLAGRFFEVQHRFQVIGEMISFPMLGRELKLDRGLVLGDLADDPLLGQLLAGAGEGVTRGQFAGDRLVQAAVAQGLNQVDVSDGDL